MGLATTLPGHSTEPFLEEKRPALLLHPVTHLVGSPIHHLPEVLVGQAAGRAWQPPWQPPAPDWQFPVPSTNGPSPLDDAKSESTRLSLLQPQPLAQMFLPPADFERLQTWATDGVPVDCGPPWLPETVLRALDMGPHKSATSPSAVELILSDISCPVDAGFADILLESELLADLPPATKISRVATIPQHNRRDRIIVNLSADVQATPSRRNKKQKPGQQGPHPSPMQPHTAQPSVNATSTPAEDQTAVKDLGNVFKAVLLFMFLTDPSWPMLFSKLDLSDGFWRMLVAKGAEFNFAWQLSQLDPSTPKRVVIPAALQMGWKNSPAFFCTSWANRMASRSVSPIPDRFLWHLACQARSTLRSGALDVEHVPGASNTMADVASRSFAQHPCDKQFLQFFSHSFPLPPQIESWQLAPLPTRLISCALSMLRRENSASPHHFLPLAMVVLLCQAIWPNSLSRVPSGRHFPIGPSATVLGLCWMPQVRSIPQWQTSFVQGHQDNASRLRTNHGQSGLPGPTPPEPTHGKIGCVLPVCLQEMGGCGPTSPT